MTQLSFYYHTGTTAASHVVTTNFMSLASSLVKSRIFNALRTFLYHPCIFLVFTVHFFYLFFACLIYLLLASVVPLS